MSLVLDDDYPELFAILARAGERAFAPLVGEEAADLGFELAEYVRSRLGGTTFCLLAYRDESHPNLFGDLTAPLPKAEPEVGFTTERGNNVDLVGFVHDAAAWLLGCRLAACDPHPAWEAASALAREFHFNAQGCDQHYIPKGESFDRKEKYMRIWERFNGRNYTQIALAEGLTETRVRQIVTAVRRAETRKRQGALFGEA